MDYIASIGIGTGLDLSGLYAGLNQIKAIKTPSMVISPTIDCREMHEKLEYCINEAKAYLRRNPLKISVDATEIKAAKILINEFKKTEKISIRVERSQSDISETSRDIAKAVRVGVIEGFKSVQRGDTLKNLLLAPIKAIFSSISQIIVAPFKVASSAISSVFRGVFEGIGQRLSATFADGLLRGFEKRRKVSLGKAGEQLGGYVGVRSKQVVREAGKFLGYPSTKGFTEDVKTMGRAIDGFIDPRKFSRKLDALEERLALIIDRAFIMGKPKQAIKEGIIDPFVEPFKNAANRIKKFVDISTASPKEQLKLLVKANDELRAKDPTRKKVSTGDILRNPELGKALLEEVMPKKEFQAIGTLIRLISQPARFKNRVLAYGAEREIEKRANKISYKDFEGESVVFAVGGFQKERGRGSLRIAQQANAVFPGATAIPIYNTYTDRKATDNKSLFLDTLKKTGFTPPSGLIDTFKNFEKLLGVGIDIKSINKDAIRIAAQLRAFERDQPNKPVNVVTFSGGNFPVSSAIALNTRMGGKAKGIGFGTGLYALAEDQRKNPNMLAIAGKQDPLGFPFQSGIIKPSKNTRIITDLADVSSMDAHNLKRYLASPQAQGMVSSFTSGFNPPPKLGTRRDEESLYEFFNLVPEIEKNSERLNRFLSGANITSEKVLSSFTKLGEFLQTQYIYSKQKSSPGAQAIKEFGYAPAIEAQKRYGQARQLFKQASERLATEYNIPSSVLGKYDPDKQSKIIQAIAKVQAETPNLERTIARLGGAKEDSKYAFYTSDKTYGAKRAEDFRGLIAYLRKATFSGLPDDIDAIAKEYTNYLDELQKGIANLVKLGTPISQKLLQDKDKLYLLTNNLEKALTSDPKKTIKSQSSQLKASPQMAAFLQEQQILAKHYVKSTEVQQRKSQYLSVPPVSPATGKQLSWVFADPTAEILRRRILASRNAIAKQIQDVERLTKSGSLQEARDLGKVVASRIQSIRATIREIEVKAVTDEEKRITASLKGQATKSAQRLAEATKSWVFEPQNQATVSSGITANSPLFRRQKGFSSLVTERLLNIRRSMRENQSQSGFVDPRLLSGLGSIGVAGSILSAGSAQAVTGGSAVASSLVSAIAANPAILAGLGAGGLALGITAALAFNPQLRQGVASKIQSASTSASNVIAGIFNRNNRTQPGVSTAASIGNLFSTAGNNISGFGASAFQNVKNLASDPLKSLRESLMGILRLENPLKVMTKTFSSFSQGLNQGLNFSKFIDNLKQSDPIFGLLIKNIKGAATAFIALNTIPILINVIPRIYETAKAFDSLERSIIYNANSTSEGLKNIEYIRTEVDRLNAPIQDATESFNQLSSALKGTKLEGNINEIFTSLNEAALVRQLTPEQRKRFLYGVVQAASKPTLSSEEVNQQIGEAFAGSPNIFARALGETPEDFRKNLRTGQYGGAESVLKFSRQLRVEFSGGVEEAVNSTQALENRLTNTRIQLERMLGSALMPLINTGLKGLNNALQLVIDNADTLSLVLAALALRQLPSVLGLVATLATKFLPALASGFGVAIGAIAKFSLQTAVLTLALKAAFDTWQSFKGSEVLDSAIEKNIKQFKRLEEAASGAAKGTQKTFNDLDRQLNRDRNQSSFTDRFLRNLNPISRIQGTYNQFQSGIRTKSRQDDIRSFNQRVNTTLANSQVQFGDADRARELSKLMSDPFIANYEREVYAKQKEAIDTRVRTQKEMVNGLLEAANAEIEAIDEAWARNEISRKQADILKAEIKKSIPALESAKKELDNFTDGQVSLIKLVREQLQKTVAGLTDTNTLISRDLTRATTQIDTRKASGELTPGAAQFATYGIQQDAYQAQIEASRGAIASLSKYVRTPDNLSFLFSQGINPETVGAAELERLSALTTKPEEKLLFERLTKIRELEGQVDQYEQQLAQSKAEAAQQLYELSKSVNEYLRSINRQTEDLTLSAQAAQSQMAMQAEKNRLTTKLQSFQSNFFSGFVDSLIGGLDAIAAIEQANVQRQQQELQNRRQYEDTYRQGFELSRQLPNEFAATTIKLDIDSALASQGVIDLKADIAGAVGITRDLNSAVSLTNVTLAQTASAGEQLSTTLDGVSADLKGWSKFLADVGYVWNYVQKEFQVGTKENLELQQRLNNSKRIPGILMERLSNTLKQLVTPGINKANESANALAKSMGLGDRNTKVFADTLKGQLNQALDASVKIGAGLAKVMGGIPSAIVQAVEAIPGLDGGLQNITETVKGVGQAIIDWIGGAIAKVQEGLSGLSSMIPGQGGQPQQAQSGLGDFANALAQQSGMGGGRFGYASPSAKQSWKQVLSGFVSAGQSLTASRGGGTRLHSGIDFDSTEGLGTNDLVQAMFPGTVENTNVWGGQRDTKGRTSTAIRVRSALPGGGTFVTDYGHIYTSSFKVKQGQQIGAGAQIARLASGGDYGSTGGHLDLKIQVPAAIAKQAGIRSVPGRLPGHVYVDVKPFMKWYASQVDKMPQDVRVGGNAGAAMGGNFNIGSNGGIAFNPFAGGSNSFAARVVGHSEGNRTVSGGYNKIYYGHSDPGNRQRNVGSFSVQTGTHGNMSPQNADIYWQKKLAAVMPEYQRAAKAAGLDPNNPILLANFLDLYTQSPLAATGKGHRNFLSQFPRIAKMGINQQTLLEARLSGFYRNNGRANFPGFGNNPARLRKDQIRRMTALQSALPAAMRDLGIRGAGAFGAGPTNLLSPSSEGLNQKVQAGQSQALSNQMLSDRIAQQQQQQELDNLKTRGEQEQRNRIESLRQSTRQLQESVTGFNRQSRDLGLAIGDATPLREFESQLNNISDTYADARRNLLEFQRQAQQGVAQAEATLSELTAPGYQAQPGQDVEKDIAATRGAIASGKKALQEVNSIIAQLDDQEKRRQAFEKERFAREERLRRLAARDMITQEAIAAKQEQLRKAQLVQQRNPRDFSAGDPLALQAEIELMQRLLPLDQKRRQLAEDLRVERIKPDEYKEAIALLNQQEKALIGNTEAAKQFGLEERRLQFREQDFAFLQRQNQASGALTQAQLQAAELFQQTRPFDTSQGDPAVIRYGQTVLQIEEERQRQVLEQQRFALTNGNRSQEELNTILAQINQAADKRLENARIELQQTQSRVEQERLDFELRRKQQNQQSDLAVLQSRANLLSAVGIDSTYLNQTMQTSNAQMQFESGLRELEKTRVLTNLTADDYERQKSNLEQVLRLQKEQSAIATQQADFARRAEVGNLRADILEGNGAEFTARRMRKELAIAQQNMNFSNQIAQLEQLKGTIPDEELNKMRDYLVEINKLKLDQIKQQFVDLSREIELTGRDATKNFFKGFLVEGKGVFESLKDAFNQMKNQIMSRLIDVGIEAIFKGRGTGSDTGGGLLGGILGSIMSGSKKSSGMGASSLIGSVLGVVGGGSPLGFLNGVLGFSEGGIVPGNDTGSDSVPAMLRPGEFVMSREGVSNLGQSFLSSVNSGNMQMTSYQQKEYSSGEPTQRSSSISIQYEKIGDRDYVTREQFEEGVRYAAQQGAQGGAKITSNWLRNSPSERRRHGI